MGWASALTYSARGQGHANSQPAVSPGPARPSTLSPLRGLLGFVAPGSAEDGPGYGGRGLRRRGAGLRRRARPSRGFRRWRAVPARARGGGAQRGAFGVRAGPSGRLGGRHAANGEGTPGPRVQPSGVRGRAGVHAETSGLRKAEHPCPPAAAAVQGQGPGRWEKTLRLQHRAEFQAQPSGQTSGEGVTGRKHRAENGRGPGPTARRLAADFQSPGPALQRCRCQQSPGSTPEGL